MNGQTITSAQTPAVDTSQMTLRQKLTSQLPCPHCSQPLRAGVTNPVMMVLKMALARGLFGHFLFRAIASKFHCATHGKIERSHFPEAHQKLIRMRKFGLLGGAGAMLVIGLMLWVAIGIMQGG